MITPKFSIETDGTIKGTTIKVNDAAVGRIQEVYLQFKGDPDNTIVARIKYWKKADDDTPITMEALKEELASVYGAYATPFVGEQLELADETIVFQQEP